MRSLLPVVAALVLVAACGSNSDGAGSSTTTADAGATTRDASSGAANDAGNDDGSDDDDAGIDLGSTSDASTSTTTDDAAMPTSDTGSPIPGIDAGPLGRYDVDGPDAATDFDVTVTGASSSYTVHVYLPSSAGLHPVVLIASGLQQKGDAYAPYAKRLASWGIAAITRDDSITHNASSVATDLEYLVSTWIAAENAKATSKLYKQLDATKVALAGHSKGGQAAFLAAEGSAKGSVRAVFGIDPVDSDSLARTSLASIGAPIAMVGETTDDSSNGCAPAADDFLVLYAAAAAPAVAITAVHADHTMFEDASACSFCSLCTAGTADQATVLAFSVRYVTAFFARELLGDSAVGAAFEGAGAASDTAAGSITITAK